ncbi:bifunctional metallophosphatase/5'-nucleotidase [Halobacillus amylolyticus]|uniref:5'-nucleotidase C-terminal domain-containing protein n=1 Tax=Halobacillus amylolyticus TaxID=2932259 RepID=A0ABY4HGQ4_9BACI|nr:5'-nucleotidase C-terminal domain-containing protein [Halobacillus amylolyticus]UOR13726.1 5'-nucleotidase C-terminal domain-containing protein [Halobacillus amylolyticus]
MKKKQLLTVLAAPVMAFSLFQADEVKAETNFDMTQLSDTELLIEQDIIKKKKQAQVHKNPYVTRLDVMKMLKRANEMKGLSPKDVFFSDSSNKSKGASPKEPITRIDMAKLFTLAMNDGNVPEVDLEVLNNFTDAESIPEEAKPYVAYATLAGGFDITFEEAFQPNEPMTLDEVAKSFKPLVFDVIDILSTNDIHGHITQNQQYQQGGMALIGGIVEDFRSVNADGTVVVDGGDTMQGTLISNSFYGKSTIETLNDIKYDAGAIGNHEFDWGVDVLKQRLDDAAYPILGANIFEEETGERPEWAKPYTIVEKGGYKIGIIGFATPQTPQTTLSTHVEGLKFPTPAPIAEELAAELEAKGADMVMVTSHLPGWHEEETDKIMGELAQLANSSEGGLDALVGGHSHERVARHVNGIPVVEADRYTNAIGHIQLFVDPESEEIYDSEIDMLETYEHLAGEDESVREIVDYYKQQVEEVKSEVVSTTEGPLTRERKYGDLGVSQLGNMITDAMRERANADIAFQNSGGIRTDINAGEITYGEVFEVLPFDNYNVTAEMTGQQLKEILEGPAPDDWNFMKIQFSGMNVVYDPSQSDGERVTSIKLTDGTPVYTNGEFSDQTFTVVTNNFLSTGEGDGYTTFGEVEWASHPDFQRELFADYLREMQASGETIVPAEAFDGRLIQE